ncbi:MAG: FkbM family methyltransferase [Saprospiraceae bacterium]
MIVLLASIIRFFTNYFLISSLPFGYYIGMLFVRLGRWFRIITYNTAKSDFHTLKIFNHVKMKVDRYSYMGGSIFWTGFHHVNETLFLKKFLKPHMTFIDIGANQGEFSLIAASILKNGRILAFEPVSFQRDLLQKNKDLNDFNNIEIFSFGLSDKAGKLPIYTSTNTEIHHGIHEGLSSLYSSSERSEMQEIVDLKVFDDIFFDNLSRLDFIKIDVEGAELFALKGMTRSIQKYKPIILIEINEGTFKNAGYSTADVMEFFRSLNYKFFSIKRGEFISEPKIELEDWGNYIIQPT